jgi:hypothetical protein
LIGPSWSVEIDGGENLGVSNHPNKEAIFLAPSYINGAKRWSGAGEFGIYMPKEWCKLMMLSTFKT